MLKMTDEEPQIDVERARFPFCIVWTPIPLLSWLFPVIGHMGIAYSTGVIRDFSRPYFVSEDDFAFGSAAKYYQLDPKLAVDGVRGWDEGIDKASNIYCKRMHNLFCDNCHSHVATALNQMKYDGKFNYNMVTVWFMFTTHCSFVNLWGFFRTWFPFALLAAIITTVAVLTKS